MAITDSRLKTGTLKLGAAFFQKQATSVSLVPATNEEGDEIEVLSGEKILPDDVTTWSLNLGLIQDFTDAAGLVEYLRAHAGQIVAFDWLPNTTGPRYTGDVKIRPTTIGGQVNTRLTSEVVLPVQEFDAPDYTP